MGYGSHAATWSAEGTRRLGMPELHETVWACLVGSSASAPVQEARGGCASRGRRERRARVAAARDRLKPLGTLDSRPKP